MIRMTRWQQGWLDGLFTNMQRQVGGRMYDRGYARGLYWSTLFFCQGLRWDREHDRWVFTPEGE